MTKKLKVGIVGARGLSSVLGLRAIEGVEVAALCDLHEGLLNEQAQKLGIPHKYRIFEDMLESDIDAVVISTPMQLHVPQTIQALEAGKHVLSEVTAGVTMDELWWLKEAVEKHSDKVYMFAENYCYTPTVQLVGNMVRQGLFGDIYFGEGEYLHDIKHLAYGYNRRVPGADASAAGTSAGGTGQKTSWRNYWQLGKRGTFYPTHSLGPLMQWFQGDRIKSISTFATGWHTAPQFRQEDTSVTMCQLESGKLIKLRLDCISHRPHNMTYYTLQGTKGCFEAPRGLGDQHKVYLLEEGADPNKAEWRPLSDFNDYLPERYRNATAEQKSAGHWGGDYFIVKDFVDAIRDGTKPPIDVYDACEWTAVALLSELSVANGGRTMDVPDFRKASGYKEQFIKL